ncbi:MAG: endoglucanase [Frankiales bacterium]|nr:endoglucanase [Frankiales bacterium]
MGSFLQQRARRVLGALVGALLAGTAGAPTVSAAGSSPFTGRGLLTVSDTTAARAATAAQASGDSATARALSLLAHRPQALWITGGTAAPAEVVAAAAAAARTRTTLVAVVYALPHRDCGGASAGGLSAAGYRRLIASLSLPLGRSHAAVVLEPDALALVTCLTSTAATERYALLRGAVSVLTRAGASVYLDAGHAHWVDTATMAARLRRAGVAAARGIALNVSSYETTGDSIRDARALAARLPGLHAVIDTSRNGLGPTRDAQWCNAAGRALGQPPHPVNDPVVDALLWVKHPGESDGSCGRQEPGAGTFWSAYAVGLVQRSSWATRS